MANQHPITPTLELMREWAQWNQGDTDPEDLWLRLCTRAAQWGADQELEACCKWTTANFGELPGQNLYLFRRPKPPSLKERALTGLSRIEQTGEFFSDGMKDLDAIRRALEALPDD